MPYSSHDVPPSHDRAGPCLRGRRLPHRPLGPRGSRRRHPRACRSHLQGVRALPGVPRGQPRPEVTPGERGHDPTAGIRGGHRPQRLSAVAAPCRPHPGLGPGADRAPRACDGLQRRLQDPGRPHLHAFRASSMPELHHRVDLRAARLSLGRSGACLRRA
jgi:hypothetical protein